MRKRAHGALANAQTRFPQLSDVVCVEMVRAYVGQLGVMQARAMALAAGMTPAQERRAAHCLQEKI
jgi:hypothetical protein